MNGILGDVIGCGSQLIVAQDAYNRCIRIGVAECAGTSKKGDCISCDDGSSRFRNNPPGECKTGGGIGGDGCRDESNHIVLDGIDGR